MPGINIDTSGVQYTRLHNGLNGVRALMVTRLAALEKLAKAGKVQAIRAWIQSDPLLRDFLSIVKHAHDRIEVIRGEVQ